MPRSYRRQRIAEAFGVAIALTVGLSAGSFSLLVFAVALLSR